MKTIRSRPVIESIKQRFSCRKFSPAAIPQEKLTRLQTYAVSQKTGPFGTTMRFDLIAAIPGDDSALKGLGTYGTIQGSKAFIVGAADYGGNSLEDYGYAMEEIILLATELDLGTCWLGGFFTRSSFSHRISLREDEQIPAVTALGMIDDPQKARASFIRRQIGASQRLPWEALFFLERFEEPLLPAQAGDFGTALEMVRWAPSASNKQPWRMIKNGQTWHFYLRRTQAYRNNLLARLLSFSDLQRVDMGIAMCHFALTMQEMGAAGRWKIQDPGIVNPDVATEYCVTWEPA
jgi:nitroreductase